MKKMINWQKLEDNLNHYKSEYRNAIPYRHIVIDEFCDVRLLTQAVSDIPDPIESNERKSNDYLFAKNKYEKRDFEAISPLFELLRNELLDERFSKFLTKVTEEEIFVDPAFHGGGLHQGGAGSFLSMHADFNYHPDNSRWFRNVNIILYLNSDWMPEYGGELQLRNSEVEKFGVIKIAPIFNRMVIMQTRENTIHGYDRIKFPRGEYRRSIAAYGYTLLEKEGQARTTIWHVKSTNPIIRILGKNFHYIVKLKHLLFDR